MGTTSDDEERPIAALVLSLLGATLILLDGAALILAGNLLSGLGYLDVSSLAYALGLGAVFFGLILFALGVQLYRNPDASSWWGIGILIFAVLAFFTGGGFLLGSVLAIVGGILAILFGRFEESETFGAGAQPMPPGPGWMCRNCGVNNAAKSWFCGRCGASRNAVAAAPIG